MIQSVLGFFELGIIILAWWVFWSWFTKALAARYSDFPAFKGLAAVLHV